MPVIDRLPVPEALGQVPPRAPCPGAEEDPVDHHPVIRPAATPRRISEQKHPQTPPFLIRGGHDDSVDQAPHLSTSPGHEDPRDTPYASPTLRPYSRVAG